MKRFSTGFLDIEQMMRVIDKRRVAFVFEDPRWPTDLRKVLRKRIRSDYCIVMALPQVRLWQRRELVDPNKCLR